MGDSTETTPYSQQSKKGSFYESRFARGIAVFLALSVMAPQAGVYTITRAKPAVTRKAESNPSPLDRIVEHTAYATPVPVIDGDGGVGPDPDDESPILLASAHPVATHAPVAATAYANANAATANSANAAMTRYNAAMAYFQNTRLPQILAEKHPVKRVQAARKMVLSANDLTPSGFGLEEYTKMFAEDTVLDVGQTLIDEYQAAMKKKDFDTARVYRTDSAIQVAMAITDLKATQDTNDEFEEETGLSGLAIAGIVIGAAAVGVGIAWASGAFDGGGSSSGGSSGGGGPPGPGPGPGPALPQPQNGNSPVVQPGAGGF